MDIYEKSVHDNYRPPHRTGELKSFSGDRAEWVAWRTEAQTKLRTDGRAIGNDEEQFGYLYMHLQTSAQRRIQQWYNMCLKLRTSCNPTAFFDRAEATFGDPNEKRNTRTLLNAIKQEDNESFSDFITRFEELLARAGGEEWPQDNQVNALEEAVNKEIQLRLVSYKMEDPSCYTFRAVCLSIDAKLQAMRMRSRLISAASRGLTSSLYSASGQRNNPRPPNNGSNHNHQERAPWASPEERERLRLEGLCLRCGRTVQVNNIPYEKSVENKKSSDGGQRTTLTNEANSINSQETQIEAKMETMLMMVDVQVNDIAYEEALVDTGNTCYITISGKWATKLKLPQQELLRPRRAQGVSQGMDEITVDFISGLLLSDGCTTIQVITDRLSKAKSYQAVNEGELTAEATASIFVERHVRYHGFSQGIVSDRGVQWVNAFWKRVCELIGIKLRLSTAYHLETDGATKRENQELERYIRCFVSYSQEDWTDLLSIAELAAKNRNSASTGFSLFFLTHGYNVDPEQTRDGVTTTINPRTPVQKAENMVTKLREAQRMAGAAIVSAQQNQEAAADRGRAPAPEYKVGGKVRLNLRHVQTDRPCKKFDWLHSKYTATVSRSDYSRQ
ncbi:hypothetical protein K3495_g11332 [Podosphaera aphanis]|nr:hypothetical protein K3495_g11332 [Podosphaera aphanis]